MANMVRIRLTTEEDYIVKDNRIESQKESIGYNVYACNDEIECWIGSCHDIESLNQIVGPDNLISSITESTSEYEYNSLMAALECQDYKYSYFGEIKTAIGEE